MRSLSDLACWSWRKHSNDHIHDEIPRQLTSSSQKACAPIRINAIFEAHRQALAYLGAAAYHKQSQMSRRVRDALAECEDSEVADALCHLWNAAFATLEQPGKDPEYLTALESGLDNETQEQFVERTGIVQQPSVRPVTGNAPKVRLTEDQVRSALIVAGDYCGMSHVRLQTEELNRILALAGTPDQASEHSELPPSAKEPIS